MEKTGPNWPLLALAVGAFGIGVTEFAPMGMLPVIADGVDVSIPSAGLLVSAYAVGVMVGAPFMTLLFSRFGKRTALIALMSIFTLGNVLSAFAPDYWTLLIARVVTSLNHGAFFGLGAVVAASLVRPEKQATAVATMFMGLTIANIGGVPVATWIGQQIGWREAFGATALLGIITMGGLALALPKSAAGKRPDVRRELQVMMRPDVLLPLFTTVLGASAMFVLYTYVAPILQNQTGASEGFITIALVLIGVGFTIGNYVGGRAADWSLTGAASMFLALLSLMMFLSPLLLGTHIGAAITLVIWGMAAFAIVPPLQMRVMQAASEAPGLASSINIGAFNLGNAIGAGIGGMVINAGVDYAYVPVAGGVAALAALALVQISRRLPQAQAC
ncbi:DHA1 family inner membrane transport protein [Rhizobium sp. BIGb0125]|uniref:MFS transporter n=1 Tax=Rhizobium sp. BIGb0125 TaxID=2940618 RepID=UPI0021690684|nr:MFS transporter [Rhizobium sp. BIGb0125]MCS4242626.1 DHA1 family inner membrane transport protein [Rhizobium sp. BIGb0125]